MKSFNHDEVWRSAISEPRAPKKTTGDNLSLDALRLSLEEMLNAFDSHLRKPTKLIIKPRLYRMAERILRAALFQKGRRKKYLKARGARK